MRLFKYIFCFFLLVFFYSNTLIAQNINDLEQKLKTASDEEKAIICNDLSEAYLQQSPDKSIEYGNLAIKYAKTNNDVNEEAVANINTANAYIAKRAFTNAISNLKGAITLFKSAGNNNNLLVSYKKITETYLQEQNYNEAITFNKLAYEIGVKLNDKKAQANCNIIEGDILFKQNNFEKAITLYQNANTYFNSINDSKMQVKLLNRIGNAYSNYGNYEQAKANLEKALKIASSNGLKNEAELINKSLAVVGTNKSNFSKSQTEFATNEKTNLINQNSDLVINNQALVQQNNLSIAEIDKLSIENQVKAYKLKAQQDELNKIKIQSELKAQQIKLLKQDAELKEIKLQKQKQTIIFSLLALAFISVITIVVIKSLRTTKKQKTEIETQKAIVEEKQKLILSAINSASLIQNSILPKKKLLEHNLKNYFVYFKPKDIVSGDFYWLKEIKNDFLFAVADCTGHGVPGAFMTLHGYNMLENIVQEKRITDIAQILNELNTAIVKTMADEEDETYVKNGMDISLIKINNETKQLEFCGAKNNIYILRNKNLIDIKSDKMSIGHIFEKSFTTKTEQLFSNDIIYLTTDGFKDQKGGNNNSCFLTNNFKNLLLELQNKPFCEQQNSLESNHLKWKGNNEQTDDICVVAIKIN